MVNEYLYLPCKTVVMEFFDNAFGLNIGVIMTLGQVIPSLACNSPAPRPHLHASVSKYSGSFS